jgi:hypothetical protein
MPLLFEENIMTTLPFNPSDFTENVHAKWTRPNTSVAWYHDWDAANWQKFLDFFSSDNFKGHFYLEIVDDLNIVGNWYFNFYDHNELSDIPVFSEVSPKIEQYYKDRGVICTLL